MKIDNLVQKYKSDKNLYNNILGTALIKACSLTLSVVSVTAYAHYFTNNDTVLGVWLTIISILTWVVNFDVGIGNGLRNHLVKHIAEKDLKNQRVCISSAYILLTGVALGIAVIVSILVRLFNWNTILNIAPGIVSNSTLSITIQIAFIGLIIQFVLRLVVSILYARKQTAIGSLPPMCSNLAIIIVAFLLSEPDPESSLIQISIVYAIIMVLPLLIVTIIVFLTIMKGARPSFRYYNHAFAKRILSLGGQFFGIQVMLMLINSTNSLIITQLVSPDAVVPYTKYYRLFSAVIALFSVIINPVWSSVSESFARKDYNGIIKRKRTINRLAFLFIFGSFILAIVFPWISNLFYGKGSLDVSLIYTCLFATYSSMMILVNSVSCIENGINNLKPQLIGCFIAVILKIPILLLLNSISNNWIWVVVTDGVIMFIAYLIQKIGLKKRLDELADELK